MKRQIPGKLSVRTVNQYRRREILAYLALRYYLDNEAARTDKWIADVGLHHILVEGPNFHEIRNFKDLANDESITHRNLFLPGPNDALTEALLLDACSQHPDIFGNLPCVFSYQLSSGHERSGVFAPYINGLRGRHKEIARACETAPNGVVHYTDIKRFYPSVSVAWARDAWNRRADKADLQRDIRDVGNIFLDTMESQTPATGTGLLVGPMFSHLLANHVFKDLDEEFSTSLPARYIRYVDDITLIGDANNVALSREKIISRLDQVGLSVHDEDSPKTLTVPTEQWLQGRHDFEESKDSIDWMVLIANLKRFLLVRPDERLPIETAFRNEEIRIPVYDYSQAVRERTYLHRFLQLADWGWFRGRLRRIGIADIIKDAKKLRDRYADWFNRCAEEEQGSTGYERKRILPKLRYAAGRLTYLAADDELASLAEVLQGVPELHLHSAVLHAVASGDVTSVLRLGNNAAQAAAQPLAMSGKHCRAILSEGNHVETQSLATLRLNGVSVDYQPELSDSEWVRFAECGSDMKLMRTKNRFLREIACLHGVHDGPRHPDMLCSAYDEDEGMALDAIDQLHQSESG